MKKRLVIILLAVVLALGCAGIGAWAATNYGTQSDPLIAQSYLDEVLRPQLEREFNAALDEAAGGLDAAAGAFASVDLSGGAVRLAAGAEVLPRGGGERGRHDDRRHGRRGRERRQRPGGKPSVHRRR